MVFNQAAFSLLTISYNCQLVNWHAYDESLVRRGEVMLDDFDVVDGWEEELEKMNEGKERLESRIIILNQLSNC